MLNEKFPPYMMDARGYCYPTTAQLVTNTSLEPWYGAVRRDGFRGKAATKPWAGKTVVCIASGPSLTIEDCAAVKTMGVPVVVTNNSWQRAPFADVIFALDHGWWQQHMHMLVDTKAQFWTGMYDAAKEFERVQLFVCRVAPRNSGGQAILFASFMGASRVVLLGYDCSVHRGTHWHGDHTRTTNPTQETCSDWIAQFDLVAKSVGGTEVINCSRETALTCFTQRPLEAVTNITLIKVMKPTH